MKIQCPVCGFTNTGMSTDLIGYAELQAWYAMPVMPNPHIDDRLVHVGIDEGYLPDLPDDIKQSYLHCQNSEAHPDGKPHWWKTDIVRVDFDSDLYEQAAQEAQAEGTIADLLAMAKDLA